MKKWNEILAKHQNWGNTFTRLRMLREMVGMVIYSNENNNVMYSYYLLYELSNIFVLSVQ